MPPSGARVRTAAFLASPAPTCNLRCVAGGFTAMGAGEEGMTASVLCTADEGVTWVEQEPLPWPAADVTAWAAGSYVYVAGGAVGSLFNFSSAAILASRVNASSCSLGPWVDVGPWPLAPSSFAFQSVSAIVGTMLGSIAVGGGTVVRPDGVGGVATSLLTEVWIGKASGGGLYSFEIARNGWSLPLARLPSFAIPIGEPALAVAPCSMAPRNASVEQELDNCVVLVTPTTIAFASSQVKQSEVRSSTSSLFWATQWVNMEFPIPNASKAFVRPHRLPVVLREPSSSELLLDGLVTVAVNDVGTVVHGYPGQSCRNPCPVRSDRLCYTLGCMRSP
jgi:hypothetical protein